LGSATLVGESAPPARDGTGPRGQAAQAPGALPVSFRSHRAGRRPLLGNLARIELKPGDSVEPGTVIARLLPLDPPLLDARTRSQADSQVAAAAAARKQAVSSVQRATAALELVSKETARQRGLLGGGAISEAAYDRAELQERSLREELASAQFGARVADHELAMAEAVLGRLGKAAHGDVMEMTSPVKGRVLRVIQQSEGAVQPGTPLVELGDPAALEIVVDVLTSDAVHVEPGAKVTIDRWGGDHRLRAHVRMVEPSAFSRLSALGVEEQRVFVVIDLDEPREKWLALGDGYRVEARIVVWEAEDVLSVPASSVFRRGDAQTVIRIDGDLAHLSPVEVGHRNADRVQVTSGLAEGTEVVLYPSEHLDEGTRIVRR
jgi:HlyD family secretion protein